MLERRGCGKGVIRDRVNENNGLGMEIWNKRVIAQCDCTSQCVRACVRGVNENMTQEYTVYTNECTRVSDYYGYVCVDIKHRNYMCYHM